MFSSKGNPFIDGNSFGNFIGYPIAGMPGSQQFPVPIMRMYGVTMEDNSVCCHVHGFSPYFFVSAPSNFTDKDCFTFKVRAVFVLSNFQFVTDYNFFLHFYCRSVMVVAQVVLIKLCTLDIYQEF